MTNPTPASFYTDGEQLVEGTIVSNDYTPSTTPSQAPSSLYPDGTAYQVSNPDVAENFASQAAASAAASLASQNASHTSEVNAAASDADATTQAATATTQAGIATTGGTTATTQAGIATTQAGIATTKAAAASTSEANAATSETNAAASAASAASHDASAATHDSNASTSATNAATSATNAAASAASASSDVNTAIANLVNGAPSTLDTLKELADAIGDDPNFATTMTTQLGLKAATTYVDSQDALKAPLLSPTFTGVPAAPTAAIGTNTTQIATTAFVLANGASVSVQDTAPSAPRDGALWWQSSTGTMFIYYNDGTSSQWVSSNPGSMPQAAVQYDVAQGLSATQKAQAQANIFKAPTTQSLTSGSSATYTTPAGVTWMEVFMVGGGGGGAGAASGTGGGGSSGSDGTASSFNGVLANPGKGGVGTSTLGQGGIGGAGGSGGTGTATRRGRGGPGGGGLSVVASNPVGYTQGGHGGNSYFAGGAQVASGIAPTTGIAGDANSGAGGAGSTALANSNAAIAPGGGAGEFVYLLIPNPSATYTYTIGAGGAGGVSTSTGGAGGSGFIFVIEHYGS